MSPKGEAIPQDDIVPNPDPNLVVDYAFDPLDVLTGPDSTYTMTMDGIDGALVRVLVILRSIFSAFPTSGSLV